MSFGGQTVTFVTVTEDPSVRDRYESPAKVRTETAVRGCRFRPAGTSAAPATREKIELGDITSERWKITAPPISAVLNAKATDEVIVDGVTYQIVGGVRPFADMNGRNFKVTIVVERRVG